ncbi:MAG: chitobiase/beta-hexosaminidase C-terminal domain-containing protein [Bacteroidaceae bacterium]|nr:chitobiase/beta-hexosaminidase C-terminal domain-containing protein [Bacteroidaceae bacterium]MBP3408756.1 chitobiase/beta-hexosaminidase C-terminal domain-containing protein [Bacteroidaceae bacterium]
MKKFLLSIFAVLFAFAGAQAETLTLTAGTDFTTTSGEFLDGSLKMTTAKNSSSSSPAYNANSKELRLYYNSGGNGGSVTFTTDGTIKITGVKVTASTTPTVKYSVNGGNMVFAGSWTGGAITISGIEATESIEIQNANTTNTQLRITSFVITYETVGVLVSKPEFTPEDGTRFDESLEVSIDVEDGLKAFYSIDGGVNYQEGNSVVITETTTILAYAEDGAGNKSAEVSATYTKNVPGQVIDELTRATTGITGSTYTDWNNKTATSSAVYAGQSAGGNDAIQLRSNNSNSGIVTTASGGKVKKVAVVWQSSTSGGRTLNVYGKNTAYSAATDLYSTSTQGTLLGTIVCGTSTELVIEGDYEYIGVCSASGAMYLTSISITWDESAGVTPVAPNAPVLPASTTFEGSMLVEITGIAADATVYYTTDESDPATSATRVEYTEPFEITATTTVKAVAVNEVGASEVVTKIYTLFVVEETEGYYIKVVSEPTDWSGKYLIVYEEGTDAYVFNGKDEANGYVSAVTDGDVIKANSEIDAVAVTIAAMEGGYSVKTAGGYIYGASGSNKLNTNASEPQLNTIEFTADGVNIEAGRYLRFNSAVGDMRFRYYNLTYGESVQLYKYVEELPTSHTLTVSEAGYATLFLGFNARIPSAVEAYTVTTVNNGWVSLTQVTGVLPAETGVIIKASAGEYKFFDEATATADVTGNLLEGTAAATEIDVEAYVLGNVDGVGLYKAKMTDGKWLNNANKAYLPASVANGAASYSFRFGEGTTGINEITDNRVQSTVIYDLTGRRVENISAPGIYIVNGKKVLVK